MGDAGLAGSSLDKLKASLTKEQVTSVLMPGDNLYSGTYSSVWDNWKSSGFKFDIVAIGNHNITYDQEVKYFNLPGEYYSVVKDGARFFVLNSDNAANVNDQFSWLEKEFAVANEKLKFLAFHHPTYTISHFHKWEEKRSFQLKMREFIKQNPKKISALIVGHDHISEFMQFGDLPVIVAGSGREVREDAGVAFTDDGIKIKTQFYAPDVQHWALLEIQPGAKEACVHLIRVADQKRVCSARIKKSKMILEANCKQLK